MGIDVDNNSADVYGVAMAKKIQINYRGVKYSVTKPTKLQLAQLLASVDMLMKQAKGILQ